MLALLFSPSWRGIIIPSRTYSVRVLLAKVRNEEAGAGQGQQIHSKPKVPPGDHFNHFKRWALRPLDNQALCLPSIKLPKAINPSLWGNSPNLNSGINWSPISFGLFFPKKQSCSQTPVIETVFLFSDGFSPAFLCSPGQVTSCLLRQTPLAGD